MAQDDKFSTSVQRIHICEIEKYDIFGFEMFSTICPNCEVDRYIYINFGAIWGLSN